MHVSIPSSTPLPIPLPLPVLPQPASSLNLLRLIQNMHNTHARILTDLLSILADQHSMRQPFLVRLLFKWPTRRKCTGVVASQCRVTAGDVAQLSLSQKLGIGREWSAGRSSGTAKGALSVRERGREGGVGWGSDTQPWNAMLFLTQNSKMT